MRWCNKGFADLIIKAAQTPKRADRAKLCERALPNSAMQPFAFWPKSSRAIRAPALTCRKQEWEWRLIALGRQLQHARDAEKSPANDQRLLLVLAGTRIASMSAASAGETWRRPR